MQTKYPLDRPDCGEVLGVEATMLRPLRGRLLVRTAYPGVSLRSVHGILYSNGMATPSP